MIKVFTNELLNFSDIDDFYKWLLKNKNVDIEYIEGSKEAECLYSFLKFYNKEKQKLNNEIVKMNDTFTDQLDNDIVKEAVEEGKINKLRYDFYIKTLEEIINRRGN